MRPARRGRKPMTGSGEARYVSTGTSPVAPPEHEAPFDLRRFLLSGGGWPYVLVPLIPLAVALELLDASSSLIFASSALGVIPTAALMGRATEELADRAGPGIGGLLNVTFGNFPELLIAFFALVAGPPGGRQGVADRLGPGQHAAGPGRGDAGRRPRP